MDVTCQTTHTRSKCKNYNFYRIMSVFPESGPLEVFPQLKHQWRWEEGHLRHQHSPDMSILIQLTGVPMREVDLLSSRQAYSFPFCPRIYHYAIGGNHLFEGQLNFDLQLLMEHIPARVSNRIPREVHSSLASKMKDLIRCFEYLRQRYGPFRIRKEMIGWTDLGVVKAWIHSDFSVSHRQQPSSSEGEMLADFFAILKESRLLENLKNRQFSTFRALREHLEMSKGDHLPPARRETNRPFDSRSQNACQSQAEETERSQATPARSIRQKNNITFSYSNKDLKINDKLILQENSSKQNSFNVIEDKQDYLTKALTLRKEITFGNIHQAPVDQTTSLKVIYPLQQRRADKKYSFFHVSRNVQVTQQLKIQKMPDYFKIKTAQRQETSNMHLLRLTGNEKPQTLNYSTSTNPYTKFINTKGTGTEDKSFSSFDQHDDFLHEQKSAKENMLSVVTINELFNSTEYKSEKRGSHQVRQDLDALFDSRHDYDENILENELDDILL